MATPNSKKLRSEWKAPRMEQKVITLRLTHDEALVFLEWIREIDKAETTIFKHPAEQKVVWKVERIIEKELGEPFHPEHGRLLAEARKRIYEDVN